MRLYKCKMLDESMGGWEACVIAVMENKEEQEFYYNSDDHSKALETLLGNSGYEYDKYHIEFRFPYELNGYAYADKIARNIAQSACDADYKDFEYISPESQAEREEAT